MTPTLSDLFGGSSSPSPTKDSYPVHNFQPKGHIIENLAKDRLRAFTSGGQFEYPSLFNPQLTQGNQSSSLNVRWSREREIVCYTRR
jgi:hypothetical protein